MYISSFTFFGSLLRFREVSSTTFCIIEKTLHLLYPFSGVHLGTREKEAGLKAVQYLLIFASKITSMGLLRSVLLLTGSLLLVRDDSTIFHGVLDR